MIKGPTKVPISFLFRLQKVIAVIAVIARAVLLVEFPVTRNKIS